LGQAVAVVAEALSPMHFMNLAAVVAVAVAVK